MFSQSLPWVCLQLFRLNSRYLISVKPLKWRLFSYLPHLYPSYLPFFQTPQLKQPLGTTPIFEAHVYNWNKITTQSSGGVKVSDKESPSAKDPLHDFCYKYMVEHITEPWWPKQSSPIRQERPFLSLFSTWKKQSPSLKVVNPYPTLQNLGWRISPLQPSFLC